MGKVRTEAVKRLSRTLVESYSDRLSTDFEANKVVVNELVSTKSKKSRNWIAGYVTRLMVIQLQRAEAVAQGEGQPVSVEDEE